MHEKMDRINHKPKREEWNVCVTIITEPELHIDNRFTCSDISVAICSLIECQDESLVLLTDTKTRKLSKGKRLGKHSQGAVLMVFVLLCMDLITSCIPAVSVWIQQADRRRQTAGAYNPATLKEQDTAATERRTDFHLMHIMWCD